jgi:DNA polymerase
MAAAYQLDLTTMPSMVLPRATVEQKEKAYNAWRRAFLRGEDYDLEAPVYQACDVLKQVYREANPRINALRKDLGAAVFQALEMPGSTPLRVGRCLVWSTGGALLIELPSGRRLCYMNPRITQEVIAEPEREPWIARSVTYATARGRSWIRTKAWDGLFVENVVQAVANDVLRATALRLHAYTLEVPAIRAYLETLEAPERTALVLQVHDEICLDVPVGSLSEATLREIMCEPKRRPDTGTVWSMGLPLAADTWINFRYGKR